MGTRVLYVNIPIMIMRSLDPSALDIYASVVLMLYSVWNTLGMNIDGQMVYKLKNLLRFLLQNM